MKLWIDGGSAHASLRCLEGKAKPKDVQDLLHVATQIIFGDELLIGAFDGGAYLEQSERWQYFLQQHDIGCVKIDRKTPLEKIYLEAARDCAGNIEAIHGKLDFGDSYTVLSPAQVAREEQFDRIIRIDMTNSQRDSLYAEVRTAENNGHLIMLAKDDELWSAVRKLVGDGKDWTKVKTEKLATALRLGIHLRYAEHMQAAYSPSRDRGVHIERLRWINEIQLGGERSIVENTLKAALELVPDNLDKKRYPEPGYPPVAAYLAKHSKGEPREVIRLAAELRDKASVLRTHLNIIVEKSTNGSEQDYVKAAKMMTEMSEDFSGYLKNRKSIIGNAIILTGEIIAFAGAVKALPHITLPAVVDVLRKRKFAEQARELFSMINSKQKFVVLTEMTNDLNLAGLPIKAVKDLEKKACRLA